jgi:bifunctional non-homologous end joining protein LigD
MVRRALSAPPLAGTSANLRGATDPRRFQASSLIACKDPAARIDTKDIRWTNEAADAWRTVSYSVGNGAALLAAARDQRLEGRIAKRLGSKYTPGRRTRDWIKIKNLESREMVMGGWLAHSDGTYGVLVGDRDGDTLTFGGVVDIGIGPNLIAALQTIEQPHTPFARGPIPRGARHCQPRLMCEVRYLAGSDALRHATLRDVRVVD